MTAAGIVGMGLWLPSATRRNDAWPESFLQSFRQHREAMRLKDVTNVEHVCESRPYDELFVRHALPYDDDPFKGAVERRVAASDVPTVEGDAAAARLALADARVDPVDVDLILSSALPQDMLVPSNGPAIQDLVGCKNAPGISVEAYCSAPLAQLDLAAALVEAGRARFVLCVQSHQVNRTNDLEMPLSPIFGDGAAAFVVGRVPAGRGLAALVRGGDGSVRGAVTFTYKEKPGATWWKNGAGPVVPGIDDLEHAKRLGRQVLAMPIDTIREVCEKARVPVDAVAVIATIQPLPWFQGAVADGLRISPDRIPSTFATYAHLGGAGVVANLIEARRRGLLRDRAPVVLYAHGAGCTRYGALLHWHRNTENAIYGDP